MRAAAVIALGLSGCVLTGPGSVRCLEGRERVDGACVYVATQDGSEPGLDAAVDAGADAALDGGGCSEVCSIDASICDPVLGCVGCREAGDCTAPADMCDTVAHRCVECMASSDCDAATPICVAGSCRRCENDAECDARSSTVCDEPSGRCVDCTVDTELDRCTGGVTCHPTDLTCSVTRGSAGFCRACTTDSDCASDAVATLRCVAMTFGSPGVAHGTYCLLDLTDHRARLGEPDALCPPPRFESRIETSVLGVTSEYCFIRETHTTCEAVVGRGDGCSTATQCGDLSIPDDALCPSGSCTYRCFGDTECGSELCTGTGIQYCQ